MHTTVSEVMIRLIRAEGERRLAQLEEHHQNLQPTYGDRTTFRFPIPLLGVIFRVWLGERIPARIRQFCCRALGGPMFVTFCDDEMRRALAGLASMEVAASSVNSRKER